MFIHSALNQNTNLHNLKTVEGLESVKKIVLLFI